jgi:hypothetical protein
LLEKQEQSSWKSNNVTERGNVLLAGLSGVMLPPLHSFMNIFYIFNITIFIAAFLESKNIGYDEFMALF